MASEEQANKARELNSRDLMRRGAHAIGVEKRGKGGWVVVAHVAPDVKANLPSTVTASSPAGEIEVPLVSVTSEPFKPE